MADAVVDVHHVNVIDRVEVADHVSCREHDTAIDHVPMLAGSCALDLGRPRQALSFFDTAGTADYSAAGYARDNAFFLTRRLPYPPRRSARQGNVCPYPRAGGYARLPPADQQHIERRRAPAEDIMAASATLKPDDGPDPLSMGSRPHVVLVADGSGSRKRNS
jgi:hypothetical protein